MVNKLTIHFISKFIDFGRTLNSVTATRRQGWEYRGTPLPVRRMKGPYVMNGNPSAKAMRLAGCGTSRYLEKTAMRRARHVNSDHVKSMGYRHATKLPRTGRSPPASSNRG
jgi:hypothetical protein